MKKTVAFLVFAFVLSLPGISQSDNAKMNTFIDALMKKMTLDEKIGQLNLPGSGDIVTGQAGNSDIGKKIKEGKVGGLFNIKAEEKIRAVQKIAVEESRLKIPLIFGMDVIHGYETVFPIPLGLSCSWDMNLIEKSASIAARKQAPMAFAGHFLQWLILPVIPAGDVLQKVQEKILTWVRKLQKQW